MLAFIFPSLILTTGAQLVPARTFAANDKADYVGWTPAPTLAPHIGDFDLLRRQISKPTSLCGYVRGNISDPVTCAATAYCGFNSAYSIFGCCNSIISSTSLTDCGFYTTCYNAAQIPSQCDRECQEDPAVYYCDNSEPYCMSFVESGYTAYSCTTAANQRYTVLQSASIVTSSTKSNSSTVTSRTSSVVSNGLGNASMSSISSISVSQISFTGIQRTAQPSEIASRVTSSAAISATTSSGRATTTAAATTTLVNGAEQGKKHGVFLSFVSFGILAGLILRA